jgi:16S rRNA (cytosine1402-N4)-methyltransferase
MLDEPNPQPNPQSDSPPIHKPIMVREILEFFKQTPRPNLERYLDGTFGRGGHTRAVLEAFPQIRALALDRDAEALQYGEANFASWISSSRLSLARRNFAQYDVIQDGEFDLMLLDLGVSSPQLDQAGRGFSFYHEGPLDMRMDQSHSVTAADILNGADENELLRIFRDYGEVHRPFRVIRAIVHDRKTKPYASTRDLAGMIERVEGWHQKGHHPATRYFMALRMAVNDELADLESALPRLMSGLKMGGRLAVLTFHSLEDRIVKNIFRNSRSLGSPVNKKVVQAQEDEVKMNSRARSAKLRVFQRSLA